MIKNIERSSLNYVFNILHKDFQSYLNAVKIKYSAKSKRIYVAKFILKPLVSYYPLCHLTFKNLKWPVELEHNTR
jgi:hypothetical protein